jgi:hypothetical protein
LVGQKNIEKKNRAIRKAPRVEQGRRRDPLPQAANIVKPSLSPVER